MGSLGPCRYYDREFDTILIDLDDTLYRVEEIPLTVRQNISGAWHTRLACMQPANSLHSRPGSLTNAFHMMGSSRTQELDCLGYLPPPWRCC
jgi:hypothetical protein